MGHWVAVLRELFEEVGILLCVTESGDDIDLSDDATQTRIERERVVMPSEIQSLPELTGYVAFAGDIPIARVKLVPQHYRVRHPAIME